MNGVLLLPHVSMPAGTLTEADIGRELTVDYLDQSITGRLTVLTENPDGTLRLVLTTSDTRC